MKNLWSSDGSSMVQNTVNHTALHAAVRLGTPVSTSAIWRVAVSRSATSAPKTFSAIWGTSSFQSPMQQTCLSQHA